MKESFPNKPAHNVVDMRNNPLDPDEILVPENLDTYCLDFILMHEGHEGSKLTMTNPNVKQHMQNFLTMDLPALAQLLRERIARHVNYMIPSDEDISETAAMMYAYRLLQQTRQSQGPKEVT